ncbi:MAG TPA: hypothetical protein VL156_00165 [Terriglobales bacterium]|jgi:hypothetical protein|nr:hypothetical protein [Terriglobales bacterium]
MVGNRRSNSRIRKWLVAAAAGAAVALVDYLLGLWMAARGLHAEVTLVDEILLGVFTCSLVFVLEASHQRERERMTEKLNTIKLMNHHVRNALQTIVNSAYAHGHTQQLDEIRTSVKRIEWALREILPGRALENGEPEASKDATSRGHPAA